MIRKLEEKDRETVLAFVGDRPSENVFIIGDIEQFGFGSRTVSLWGDFDQDDHLRSMLLRFAGNFIPYARDPKQFDGEAWARQIEQTGRLKMISGLKELTDKLTPFITRPEKQRKLCYYARRENVLPLDGDARMREVRMLFPEESDAVIRLWSEIPEFTGSMETAETLQKNMENGFSRTYYIEKDDAPVSAVSTTAETASAAMIVGVCTKKAYEHHGFATACLRKMIHVLKSEHKQPCLFYDNPEAGKIYRQLGFVSIGLWAITSFIS
ncbi:GNAT family N-acetyltransferase [Sporolactobacillus vineae]|uniref:GNAT family N-acetyltransferase n=1 Tax=Sporolactobacillus vineae TaxID=444463 RepID=UPI000309886D|nr:GNAT family N-acetyltransferase [Sporolactobacillus vineae]